MLTKEDIEIIRRIVDKCIDNVRKIEIEKVEKIENNLFNELMVIINKSIKWHNDNAIRKRDVINRSVTGIMSKDEIDYTSEEYKELRAMYKDIVKLLT